MQRYDIYTDEVFNRNVKNVKTFGELITQMLNTGSMNRKLFHHFVVMSLEFSSVCSFAATNQDARNPVNVPNNPTPVVIRKAAMIRPSVVTGYLSP